MQRVFFRQHNARPMDTNAPFANFTKFLEYLPVIIIIVNKR